MKYLTLLFLILLFTISLSANDGAFFAEGNQLVPIGESDIRVQKEILTIKRKNAEQVEVTVYYEFVNPKDTKSLTVGFEARSPSGDVNGMPKNGEHPYMCDFTVEINNKILPYKIAYVADSLYYRNGKLNEVSLDKLTPCDNNCEFNYIYHFDATFNKGVNVVKHSYTFDLSGGIDYNYYFDYVLTAAMRWGNKQIDDFTLIIDMGEFQDFYLDNAPFGEWVLTGLGKVFTKQQNPFPWEEKADTYNHFYMLKGQIVFQKKNFKPQSELIVLSKHTFVENSDTFNHEEQVTLPINYTPYEEAANKTSKKILRNYPFARRGYIFTSSDLKEYYSNQIWYIPNPNYKAEIESLSTEDQEWVKRWSK